MFIRIDHLAKGKLLRKCLNFTFSIPYLANYLRKYEYQEITGFDAGKSFEHYVFLELIAYKYLNNKRDELFYWRTKEGYEIDFIFQNNDAFEVKIASSIQKNHLEGLLEFSKDSDFKLHIWTFSIELSIIK
ncbi:DUF4143 domain-containing protein [Rickettsia parkeri]|uniref:DUF4143 domain-containing protein n=1 Tax=Rickettsia parkeri TaxID=35792 RepID=UPI003965A481